MVLSEKSAHKAKLEIRHAKETMSFCMNLFFGARALRNCAFLARYGHEKRALGT